MFIALKEILRAKVRFALLTGAIALLAFLILFQQSLQNGLLTSFVGAIRNQSAPVLVYTVDGQRVLQGSVITPDLEELISTADGIGDAGRLSQGTFAVVSGDGELTDTAVIGYERADLGGPSNLLAGRLPAAVGEVVGADADAEIGFGIGDVVRVEPGGLELLVVGLAGESQLNAGPTLFTDAATYLSAVQAANPDAREPLPNAIALRPADGVTAAELVASVNGLSDDLDALTRSQAADLTPGVSQVRQSFSVIFLLYALVIPCVTGLFFLILTFQKSGALTLLRAIGAPSSWLVTSLLLQAIIVLTAGFAIGLALYLPLSQRRLGSIQLQFETGAVIVWGILITVLGVLSALVAARRVLRIEPIEATTGGGSL